MFSSCGKKEYAEQKLHILVDLPVKLNVLGLFATYDDVKGEDSAHLKNYLKKYMGVTEDVEYEFLPEDKAEREVRIQALRTEIMAGGGPDIFLVVSDPPGGARGSSIWNVQFPAPYEREMLFANPETAMESKLFLPLDDYLKDNDAVDTSLIFPAVLEAGKTEEGQMILPITFTFPVATCLESFVPKQLPENWESGISNENPAVRNAYTAGAWHRFSDSFESMVKEGSLAFSKSELLQRVKSALASTDMELIDTLSNTNVFVSPDTNTGELNPGINFAHEFNNAPIPFPADSFGGFLSIRSLHYRDTVEWDRNHYDHRWAKNNGRQSLFALQNEKGGVTADITAYAAVNRNSKHTESAFQALDMMLSTPTLTGWGMNESEKGDPYSYQLFTLCSCFGVPARGDLLGTGDLPFFQARISKNAPGVFGENVEVFSEYTALRNEVTHARFYGTLDQELQTMYEACLEAESDEEIEKIVSKAYDTMLMILAES
ncbi:hypothetical protein [uncultured Neglectibacter sp.]|uniref:hypothetical protein n=1 Tax=uncultured Neglectibacter sp. TaxID=1924108 RepID=UPI0034DF0969